MNFVEYADREMMMIDIADKLAGELRSTLQMHDWASFAVPGGTTPGPIFDTLSGVDLDWPRVHVMLTDERWVPESSERSNTRLVKQHLFTDRAASATYVPLYAEAATPEEKLADLNAAVMEELPLSILLLGMGADMHIASLFPGADRLEDALANDAPPLMAMRAPGTSEPRITLTAPVLRDAMSTHIVITGAEKREALERARKLRDPLQAPVWLALGDATVHWAE